MEGEKVQISKPGKVRSRKFQCDRAVLERKIAAGKTVSADKQPVYRSELDVFCDKLGIARKSLVIRVGDATGTASFMKEGKIWFASPKLPDGRYWTRTPEQINELVKTGAVKVLPQVRCTTPEGRMRFPCARDEDLKTLGPMLAAALPARERPKPSEFRRREYALYSPVGVWRELADVGDEIGRPDWADSVRKNVESLIHPRSDGEHCVAAYLLYLLTVERSSVLGRPVLQRLYSNDNYERKRSPKALLTCRREVRCRPRGAAVRSPRARSCRHPGRCWPCAG